MGFKPLEDVWVQFDQFHWSRFRFRHKKPMMEGVEQSLPKITQEIIDINEELKIHNDRCSKKRRKKIHNDRLGLRLALETTVTQSLQDPASTTGNSLPLSNSSRRLPTKDGKPVGLEKDLEKVLGCLTRVTSNFQVFPVTGMAGIGKTTFAKELYNHPLLMHHFDICAWVTVSQEYQPRRMLLGLLSLTSSLSNLSDEIIEMSDDQLRERLYRSLKGKRYFVVLDDVWDKKAWDDLKRAFPNDNNGSRALLTSQLSSVAIHANPNSPPHCLQFLSPEESWKLLCSKIFVNESPPMELVPIGKQIAHKCHGLPLAVVVIGGLLSKMNKSSEVWEKVCQNIGSMVMNETQDCQSILALSYSHLPDSLKACLLYMGVFPEDYDISSKKLMYLWIAEGFVQSNEKKTLEEVAEDYLAELIARSIVMVKRKRPNGMVKTCHIHDLMRDYCIRESCKENFLHVIHNYGEMEMPVRITGARNKYKELVEKGLQNLQRLSLYSNIHVYMQIRASFPFTRSFFCFEALRSTDLKGSDGIFFRLLKVLDIMHIHLLSLPPGIVFLSNLKYLALTIVNPVPLSELSLLPGLQTCIVDGELTGFLFRLFFRMKELRHFYFRRILSQSFHDAFFDLRHHRELENVSLPHLQSLSTVSSSSIAKKDFLCLPNLRTLAVYGTEDHKFLGWFKDLVHLTQLKTLKYTYFNPFASRAFESEHLPPHNFFPPKLMKLSLSGTSFPWEDMRQLSMLPNLEVLKLKNYAFSGEVWKLGELSFNCLKFLLVGSTNLEVWEADDSHFPSLEHLVLRHCRSLKEIPYGIGDAPLLEKIELHCCSESAAISARELQEEQQNLGNDLLTVYITQR